MRELLTAYATGLAGIAIVAVAWVAVQTAWKRAFPSGSDDPDVLAGRTGCGNCGCVDKCAEGKPVRRDGKEAR